MPIASPTKSLATALREFRDKRFAHVILKDSLEDLELLIDLDSPPGLPGEEQVIVVVGPTGAGKTTLLKRLEKRILERYAAEMEANPSLVPVIYMKLPAPGDGNYSWKDHFHRLLEMFADVLIRKKVITHPQVSLDGEDISNIRSLVRDELRRAVRNEVVRRGTRALLLDEAGHLLLTRSGITARTQFELVKSIAIELGIPIILCGDYALATILETNGQLTRRCDHIHVCRYQLADLQLMNARGKSFQDLVHTILAACPIPIDPLVEEHLDYFYMRTIGNPGLLHRWVWRAARQAVNNGDHLVTKEILEATRWPNKALKWFLNEALLGESMLEDLADAEIAKALGFEVTPSLGANTSSLNLAKEKAKTKKKPSSKSGGRIGSRSPGRDPVGGIPCGS